MTHTRIDGTSLSSEEGIFLACESGSEARVIGSEVLEGDLVKVETTIHLNLCTKDISTGWVQISLQGWERNIGNYS